MHAHGRHGDVLVALSTSGASANVLAAADAARDRGLTVWGLTGPGPTALAERCDETLEVDGPTTATVQELHLVGAARRLRRAGPGGRRGDARPAEPPGPGGGGRRMTCAPPTAGVRR